ncbi:MAG: glutamine--fructose-6-phosphate aminotransferase [Candidatus Ryanbacteria bacterium RIFCSPHIGHO2_02_FULL_45_13b]|uniref:Glutamine--fructose-6-phosphate aminotransferase [isomerizing] n=1 Tax=Candidatus Ryanbacteria bacterium RIFCSPHIGHO2_02_FULL_45_13b TaxID=1802117 RepID=A0A1G2G747_9BACT|nr:MAG: glutamine--fructose-6-phosphate aminotransferase [Candidatus Ryanbacteria bacterium RIFCSPHIGHO2_02_FULL_45_13b]
MCGIISYIGKQEALPILLDGLYRLEYRGYDSAGVAVIGADGNVGHVRAVGKVDELSSLLNTKPVLGFVGIAHTRWATHGAPSVANAHPHTDCKNSVFVAHNGIIENHRYLRSALEREGHTFVSETDSEVLTHLIERSLTAGGKTGTLEDAVSEALRHVEGTYGIAVVSKSHPERLVVVRKSSPLLLGIGEGEFFAASDSSALLRHTRRIVHLDDNELAVLTPDGYEVCNMRRKPIIKQIEFLTGSLEDIEKSGYEHFMEKEIHEAPDVLRNAMRGRMLHEEGTAKLSALDASVEKLSHINRIIFLSQGTSYYAGLVGTYMMEELSGIPAEVLYASEFRYAPPPLNEQTLVVAISQSGETADTLEAIREAKRHHVPTLAIVNVVGSSIAREAGMGIYNYAGPEIGVASTKAFISQLAVLSLVAVWFGRQRALSMSRGKEILEELQQLPHKAEKILSAAPHIHTLADEYASYDNFFFLGRKYNWPVALEGALKLKEISYAHAEGYAAGEMKHGPIALITSAMPSVVIAPRDSVYEKSVSIIHELKARGGNVFAVATEGDTEIASIADRVVYIPQTLEILSPILTVIPLQLFAYFIAKKRGCDIDKPRNLAKSVTVE